ncbi:Glyoxalase-like domain protein [Pseudoruegeria aquimaris]|uniref:Glyoxalase-like domain protein n=1 Tax=Pseudoruegeria aquimaris TaxID=393663 RepID=A0A1Y5R822_9RHOB|nr:VOC family protein [Pseudoruegeria aquimaris]SLN10953.1 Glyoxalase-like domain protein [Pseudoruegeria aquimaris]
MPLEHLNVTVADPRAAAETLCALFDWEIRWEGASIYDGLSVHVGDDASYLALYSPRTPLAAAEDSYHAQRGLNHIGIVVRDLEETEARVKAAGYRPRSHADYEPGRRFYFTGPDGIEFEAVQYD